MRLIYQCQYKEVREERGENRLNGIHSGKFMERPLNAIQMKGERERERDPEFAFVQKKAVKVRSRPLFARLSSAAAHRSLQSCSVLAN